jgi:hypothetical protein
MMGAAALLVAVVVVGTTRLKPEQNSGSAGTAEVRSPDERSVPVVTLDRNDSSALPRYGALAPVAARWVAAMWSRQPGESALGWLDRVGDITDPLLEASLRTARPVLLDAENDSTVVEVLGVYPDALDAMRFTVTCIAHRTRRGVVTQHPCSATVSLSVANDGRVLVTAVR